MLQYDRNGKDERLRCIWISDTPIKRAAEAGRKAGEGATAKTAAMVGHLAGILQYTKKSLMRSMDQIRLFGRGLVDRIRSLDAG